VFAQSKLTTLALKLPMNSWSIWSRLQGTVRNLPCIGVLRKDLIAPQSVRANESEVQFFSRLRDLAESRNWSWNVPERPRSLNCSYSLFTAPALHRLGKRILVAAGVEFVGGTTSSVRRSDCDHAARFKAGSDKAVTVIPSRVRRRGTSRALLRLRVPYAFTFELRAICIV